MISINWLLIELGLWKIEKSLIQFCKVLIVLFANAENIIWLFPIDIFLKKITSVYLIILFLMSEILYLNNTIIRINFLQTLAILIYDYSYQI